MFSHNVMKTELCCERHSTERGLDLDRRDMLQGAASTTLLAAASLSAFPLAEAAPAAPLTQFRIYPAICIARVGDNTACDFGPKTTAGELPASGEALWGGLPLDSQTGLPRALSH